MPALLIWGAKFFASKVGVYILMALAGAALMATAAFYVHSYQERGRRVAELEAETTRIAEAAREAERAHLILAEQLRADIAAAQATATRRADDLRRSVRVVANLRNIKVPDVQIACPVHPAIGAALDELRLP